MSRIVKLAVAAIAISLTAAIAGIVAHNRGRAAPPEGAVRYELSLASPAPVVAGRVRGPQAQPPGYRLRLAPNTVVELGPRPNCHYLTWRTIRAGSDAR